MDNIKSTLGLKEMRNYRPLLQQLFAELLGTFLYLSLAPLAEQEKVFGVMTVGLSNGLIVASIVQIIGNVSGGHINPAVTVGAMVCGEIKVLRALCYVTVQILGGIAGAATSYAILNTALQENFGGIIQYGHEAIFALELLLTFVLVSVALSVTDPFRGTRGLGSAALAIGLCVTAGGFSSTFCLVGMNPVRVLSTAVIASCVGTSHVTSRDWSRVWIYCAAPIMGGLLAGLVYRFVLNLKIREREELTD